MDQRQSWQVISHWPGSNSVVWGKIIINVISQLGRVNGCNAEIYLLTNVFRGSFAAGKSKKAKILLKKIIVTQQLIQRMQPLTAKRAVKNIYIYCLYVSTVRPQIHFNSIKQFCSTILPLEVLQTKLSTCLLELGVCFLILTHDPGRAQEPADIDLAIVPEM